MEVWNDKYLLKILNNKEYKVTNRNVVETYSQYLRDYIIDLEDKKNNIVYSVVITVDKDYKTLGYTITKTVNRDYINTVYVDHIRLNKQYIISLP